MARKSRLNLPGVPQHVVQRGNNRQPCFLRDADYMHFLNDLNTESSKNDCLVHAYVLMTNHIHLLVTPNHGEGVSKLMMGLGRKYVRYFNDFNDRTGTLWEGRFKSSYVISPEYCIACYRYIEMNPVRAGLVSHPGTYPWSSYRVNGMGVHSKLISPHDTWLGLGKCNDERTQMYRSLVGMPLDEGVLSEIRCGFAKGNSLGLKEGDER